MAKSPKTVLSAQDWAEAALDAISESGVAGVAVEPLARALGVTKGSFYWHFSNREALLEATLKLWEARETDEVLERVRLETDPRERIRRMVTEVNTSRRASRIYMALSNATSPAFVRNYVERVSQRRLSFITDCYAALGLSNEHAWQWALHAYSVWLGSLQIRRDLPHEWPTVDNPAFTEYLRFLMERLMPPRLDADNEHGPSPVPADSSAASQG